MDKTESIEAIVIGASAGALDALTSVLSPLPAHYAIPIMVVVHLPPDKKSVMAEVLQNKILIKVKEAEDKEKLQPATIYIAPPDYHLLAENDKSLSLSVEEPVLYSRPSINVLFETAADAYGSRLVGIILTGANHDGADGLKKISEEGGIVAVLDPAVAHAPTMPEAALEACPDALVFGLEQMASFLKDLAKQ